ncbi:MAG: PQQ-dependent sugar dehydrogenase [Gammaproteobacteria bacterium]|nr:PQQ-dependent sugar dehydrogenase [Gammaproteobacteria bacterium]
MRRLAAVGLALCAAASAADELPPRFVDAYPKLRFQQPTFIVPAPDDPSRLFVVSQAGRIHAFRDDPATEQAAVFLDIGAKVRNYGEQGLLGLAFDPGYAQNGFFYVNYVTSAKPRRTIVSRFRATAADAADPNSETVLLEFEQPYANHNGGMLAFGPDGKLYVAAGDGGSANDPHDNAQSLSTVLGKILRLNPDGSAPRDNPFVGRPGARGEIWAYGLRNPWRFSFDRETAQLWAADVGQDAQEEIDLIVKGGNYGWRYYEGTRSNVNPRRRPISDFIAPVHAYGRDRGGSVTGGYVYRGRRIPALRGAYVYGDFTSGRIWALRHDGPRVVDNREIGRIPYPSSFGEAADGELFVCSYEGAIYRLEPAAENRP